MTTRSYTVIGAGNGGKAMAAHLALMDCRVVLYNRTPDRVRAIRARGGIDLESADGGPRGFGKLALVTSDMKAALDHAEMIMVVVPSSAHAEIAAGLRRTCAMGRLSCCIPAAPAARSSSPRCCAIKLHGRCDRRRSRDLYLRQPLGWPGPGAHLPHQGSGAAGGAAGAAHARSARRAQAGLSAVYRWRQRAAHRAEQHGRDLSPGADPAQRRAGSNPPTATFSSTSTASRPRWRGCWRCWTASG